MISSETAAKLQSALPFWMSFLLIPFIWLAAFAGGWWVLIIPVITWYLFSALDVVSGLNLENVDPETSDDQLRWYVSLTSAWVPIQFLTLFGLIYYVLPLWGPASRLCDPCFCAGRLVRRCSVPVSGVYRNLAA